MEGASAPGDVIRLEAIGSAHPLTLYAYKNGALLTQYTTVSPSEVKTGGSPGILIYDGGHALSVDDWSGGPAHTSRTNGYSNGYSDSYGNCYRNTNGNGYVYADASANRNANPDSDTNTNPNTYTNGDTNACAWSGGGVWLQ